MENRRVRMLSSYQASQPPPTVCAPWVAVAIEAGSSWSEAFALDGTDAVLILYIWPYDHPVTKTAIQPTTNIRILIV